MLTVGKYNQSRAAYPIKALGLCGLLLWCLTFSGCDAALSRYLKGMTVESKQQSSPVLDGDRAVSLPEKRLGAEALESKDPDIIDKSRFSQRSRRPRVQLPPFSRLEKVDGHAAPVLKLSKVGSPAAGGDGEASLLSGDADGEVLVWDLGSGQAYKLFSFGSKVDQVTFHPGLGLAAAAGQKLIKVVDLGRGTLVSQFDRLRAQITSLGFSASGASLVVGGGDSRVYRWRYLTEPTTREEETRLFERYIGHGAVVSTVACHPAGRVFFSGDWRGGLNAWLSYDADMFEGEYDENLFGWRFFADKGNRRGFGGKAHGGVEVLDFVNDGEFLVVGYQDGFVELWRVRGLVRVAEASAHKGLIYSVSGHASQPGFVTSGRDGLVRMWRIVEEQRADSLKPQVLIEMAQELEVLGAKQLLFWSESRVFAVREQGDILELAVNPEALTRPAGDQDGA